MLADEPRRRPSAAEVRDRAEWLTDTLESARPRPLATPALGVAIREGGAPAPGGIDRRPTPDFVVRIRG